MHYKTIVLELLQEQYPVLHEQLRKNRTLLSTVNDTATALKRYHETQMDRLTLSKPNGDPAQLASQAMELALEDLRGDLPCESASPESGDDPLSLDAAMAFLRSHTPPA
jgi:hypothetical protein